MEKISLKDIVDRDGQCDVASRIGCHQTAISAAILKNRQIYLELKNGKIIDVYEIKPVFGFQRKKRRTKKA